MAPPSDLLRVLLVDDHAFLRAGLRELLEERGVEVVGEASDGDEAVEAALALAPDVVLMDLNMPRVSGVEATRTLLATAPDARVLILTVSQADEDVSAALVAGASGYVLKDAPIDLIVEGLRSAARGESMLSPVVAVGLVGRLRDEEERRVAGGDGGSIEELSPRELDVLALLAEGQENAEIAAALYISTNTVKNHISAILRKLGAANRIEAAVRAHQQGLVRRDRG